MKPLTKNEEQVLLAVLNLGEASYLVTIRDFLRKKTGKELSFDYIGTTQLAGGTTGTY